METETNIERCWLILIVCPCPNCNYPSITMLLPGFEPSERFIDNVEGPIWSCERCHVKHRITSQGCHRHVVPWSLKKDFETYNQDK